MKSYFTFALIYLTVTGCAHHSRAPLPAAQESRFVYLEFLPNSKKEMIFQSPPCHPDGTKDLLIQTFVTSKKVKDGDVNVLNIYAYADGADGCEKPRGDDLLKEAISLPQNGRFTHVYITLLSQRISVF